MARLFVALDVPRPVRRKLLGLMRPRPGVRWVREEQLHLTLRFLGHVEEAMERAVRERLDAVQAAPFSLRLGGTGVFPGPARPRVLWVGAHAEAGLLSLQQAVEAAVVDAGLPPENRPFHPHVTLARLQRPDTAWIRAFLRDHVDFEAGSFTVGHFALYASTLRPAGAVYERLADFPLNA
ncbi:MAG: RNA 2',3'-cyclic phosphodiesterase [Rhodothermaceae bacterium]|nr:MAG: RNA 2',3'-cyclic phosphodiesterase [Rhodothermaceae bacterium]